MNQEPNIICEIIISTVIFLPLLVILIDVLKASFKTLFQILDDILCFILDLFIHDNNYKK